MKGSNDPVIYFLAEFKLIYFNVIINEGVRQK